MTRASAPATYDRPDGDDRAAHQRGTCAAMNEYFDLSRIVELREALGSDVGAIVASVLSSMTGAIERAEAAVARGEFDQATQDAHRARNDALMLAAGQLQSALAELEVAARDGDETAAEAALERVQEVWSPTRDALAASVESG